MKSSIQECAPVLFKIRNMVCIFGFNFVACLSRVAELSQQKYIEIKCTFLFMTTLTSFSLLVSTQTFLSLATSALRRWSSTYVLNAFLWLWHERKLLTNMPLSSRITIYSLLLFRLIGKQIHKIVIKYYITHSGSHRWKGGGRGCPGKGTLVTHNIRTCRDLDITIKSLFFPLFNNCTNENILQSSGSVVTV